MKDIYYEQLIQTEQSIGRRFGEEIYPLTQRVKETACPEILSRKKALPESVRLPRDPQMRLSGALYDQVIKPWMPTGHDAFKPRPEDIEELCKNVKGEDPTDFVQYYALSKTRSQRRTGSPDGRIDCAELEMLSHHASVTKASEMLGLSVRSIIVDETPLIPDDQIMQINEQDRTTNKNVANSFLTDMQANQNVIVRPLDQSVQEPLGRDFNQLYRERLAANNAMLNQQIENGLITPLTIRIAVMLDCTPDSGLKNLGLNENEIEVLRKQANTNLANIDRRVLKYLKDVTVHVASIMDLREETAKRVCGNPDYPEHNAGHRIYGGVTRSSNRWSFLPHPTKFHGKTINAMHGLAVYDNEGRYLGVETYENGSSMQKNDEAKILNIGCKPVAIILQSPKNTL